MSECRNCGGRTLQDVGSIGRVEPFFLKRVYGLELRPARSADRIKQIIRYLASLPVHILSRVHTVYAFLELQVCSDCSFLQTKVPFHEDDITRLYIDYRGFSYNQERIKYEPSYARIVDAVGLDETEVRTRTKGLNEFLNRTPVGAGRLTMLDYGGSDGRFMPDLPGNKYVYDVSSVPPLPGITRVRSRSELSTYSLVILAHVVEHLAYPLKLVRELRSYVDDGGYLYIETPQDVSDRVRNGLLLGTSKMQIGIHEHINSYCVRAVSKLLEAAGFEVVAIECTPVDLGWAKSNHIRALGRKLTEN